MSYLTLDRLVDAVGAPGAGFCTVCLTGVYPVEIPPELGKGVLEGGEVAAAEGVTSAPAALLSADERGLPTDSVRPGAPGSPGGGGPIEEAPAGAGEDTTGG